MPRGFPPMRLAGSLVGVVAIALVLGVPEPAGAVRFSTPAARDVVDTVSVRVSSGPAEPTVTAALLVDGVVASRASLAPSSAVTLVARRLRFGWHAVRAVVATSFGEPPSSDAYYVKAWGRPRQPVLHGTNGRWVGARQPLSVRVGPGTARVTLVVAGRRVRSVSPKGPGLVSLGTVPFRKGTSNVDVIAWNPAARTSVRTKLTRLDYPWPTCIVIDKSDYRLYWIRDGRLVGSYPIAHGRNGWTPAAVWRIGAKYTPDPHGIYGPRKMRLFRRVGGRYVFTRYGIHGTNQPWVIGTQASHGCIRMYNRDVLGLWPQVPLGTMVLTRE